ncbi:sulfotransferase family protein [Nevskia ramosa]|uniref:sulfotransferase family protein n=1 Tax=Nevskia ramosa TaxID=64002 RepID=UPI0003B5CCC7|nr:sulfotransferase [Nevskia ramosa]
MTETIEAAVLPKTVPELLAAARAMAGLEDFGDLSFMKALEVLIAGFREEAQFSAMGEQLAYGGVINMLVNRLRYVRDVKAHPEILDEKIVKPIVVLGLPRTGTTKLQRILSADPQAQGMMYWKMMNPAPFPDEEPGNPKGRIEAAQAAVAMLTELYPAFVARHPTEALQPDEEVLLMQGSFDCVVTWLFARSTSFYDHVMNEDRRPVYQYLFSQMQYLQWQEGGARGRGWVLKSPCHTGLIDILLETFPDAVLVHCHRDVNKLLPSIAGLVEEMRRIHSDHVDRKVLGDEMLDYFGRSMDRYLELRDQLPSDRILDVRYEEVVDNALDVVRRIYERAGRTFTPETAQLIGAWEEQRPPHYLGHYSYSAADYGYASDTIDRRFAAYGERFRRYITTDRSISA